MDPRRMLATLGDDDQTVTDIRRVLRALMKEFGGPEGFASLVAQDYRTLDAGDAGRIRLGDSILRMLGNFGEQTEGDDGTDLKTLEARAKELLGGTDPDAGGSVQGPANETAEAPDAEG